ncbi:MAG TPA: dipeptidase, partial [Lachnospiraceae bacterium]|nr:dipeptidase [Lachnospiraceae bacterium]
MKVVDMHCDTISELYSLKRRNEPGSLQMNSLHLDLEKMRKGGYLLQNFAIFLSMNDHENLFEDCIKMIDLFYQEMEANKDTIAVAYSYDDMERNEAQGKLSALLTIEEGAVTKGSLEYLRTFYRLGVRMLTLTWNFKNEIGYPNFDYISGQVPDLISRNSKNGLTEFGVEFIHEMERLGMIVDVSHLSDAGFHDVLKHTTKPFVASHSNAVGECNICRNLTDDMIRKLSARGGVMGINYCPSFLHEVNIMEEEKAYGSVERMVAHIKHIRNVGGIECIGLGSDFDGISGNIEVKDASLMPL